MTLQTSTGVIARLYQAAFGRTPDQAGVAFWDGQLSAGLSIDRIASFFVDSDEFTAFAEAPSALRRHRAR